LNSKERKVQEALGTLIEFYVVPEIYVHAPLCQIVYAFIEKNFYNKGRGLRSRVINTTKKDLLEDYIKYFYLTDVLPLIIYIKKYLDKMLLSGADDYKQNIDIVLNVWKNNLNTILFPELKYRIPVEKLTIYETDVNDILKEYRIDCEGNSIKK